MNRRAVSLLSGGLDSLLATKIVMDENIETFAVHFTSPFFSLKERKGREIQAVRSAKELGVEIILKEKDMDYMKIVENPKYGYGKNMNPCIDCRIYMLRKAKEVMLEKNASFIVTGEVLGQRPMSQTRQAMKIIERETGLEGLVLRPLSAKLLPPTKPEIEGIIQREHLLDLSGKGRKAQFEYAKRLNLREFSYPAGGCLLTDPNFSRRIKDLLAHTKDYSIWDILLLRIGRHIRINERIKFIVGRDEEENKKIEAMHRPPHVLISPINFKGPKALLIGEKEEATLKIGASILAHYGKHREMSVLLEIKTETTEQRVFERTEFDVEEYIL